MSIYFANELIERIQNDVYKINRLVLEGHFLYWQIAECKTQEGLQILNSLREEKFELLNSILKENEFKFSDDAIKEIQNDFWVSNFHH